MFSSCSKDPKMKISSKQVVFEAYPEEDISIHISSNIQWEATLRIQQNDKWLNFVEQESITANPIYGRGNGNIVLNAKDNTSFNGRSGFIVISGDGVQTDTIYVSQSGSIDVADIIEDDEFRKYCLAEFDKAPKDDKLSLEEVRNVNRITVTGKKIYSLVGIEYFTGLIELLCANNHIQTINLTYNKSLMKLDCSYNPINDIDVGELTELKDLIIDRTNIKTINVSKNEKLERLYASGNHLTNIDLSNNTELEWLYLDVNQLENIDLKKNNKLKFLYCTDNMLKTLELANNKSLERLWCNNNLLSGLVLTQNTALQYLSCSQNSIVSLNLDNLRDLEWLYCDKNQITSLDVSRNTKLTDIRCTSNNLTSLDVKSNKELKILYFSNNRLTSLDVSQNLALQRLECDLNSLTSLDLNNNKELIELYCYGNQIKTLHLSTNTKLTDLRCYNCNLNDYIDIRNNKSLVHLQVQINPQLAEIWVWQGFNTNNTNYKKDQGARYIVK